MARISQRLWLALVAAIVFGGCARFAVRPDSPAAQMDATGMWERRCDEQFYLIVFGSQSAPKRARWTHSWATLVRVQQQPSVLSWKFVSGFCPSDYECREPF